MRAQDIESMAAHWLIELQSQPSPGQSDAFHEWLGADVRHRAAFERQSSVWTVCDDLKKLRPSDGTIDLDMLMRADLFETKGPSVGMASETITDERAPSSCVFRVFAPLAGMRQAIAIAMLLGVTIGILRAFGGSHQHANTYTTDIGGRKMIALEDGTSVELNTDSEVRVHFTAAARRIDLIRGEALFHVAHDARRPLMVNVGEELVQDLGTEFSVHLRSAHEVRMIVIEGSVRVSPLGATGSRLHSEGTVIFAGSMASIQHSIVVRRILDPDDIGRRLAWTEGHLAFNGETLTDVVTEFNRYNREQLLIVDSSIKNLRIGGSFSTTHVAPFLSVLQDVFDVQSDSTFPDRRIIRLRSRQSSRQ